MAKKKYLNIEKGQNLGINLNDLVQTEEQQNEVKTKEYSIKTFMVNKQDMEFIENYILYMGYVKRKKYTQREAISDAISMLKEKYKDEMKI